MLNSLAKQLGLVAAGKRVDVGEFVASLVGYLIVLALILSIGKYLWNDVLVNLVSVVKPVKSIWQLLGLQILLSLLFGH